MEVKIKGILFTFAIVTTLEVFASAIFITVFWNKPILSVDILWQILISSGACSLGNLIYSTREPSKTQFVVRVTLHYIYINVVVLGLGLFFKWFYMNQLSGLVGMLVSIAVVFSLVWLIMHYQDTKLANRFNQRLEEYNKEIE